MSKTITAKIFTEDKRGYFTKIASVNKTILNNDQEFVFQKRTFDIDLTKTAYIDKLNHPVLFYALENSVPLDIQSKISAQPVLMKETQKMPSSLSDKLFRRRMMASILSAATRAKETTPSWIMLLTGGMAGAISIIILVLADPSIFGLVHAVS